MRLIDWIIGREPVATATGIAAIVTAGLGVAHEYGLKITPGQIAAIGTLAAALAGFAARAAVVPVRKLREPSGEAGGVPLALILLLAAIATLLVLSFASCDALLEDDDEVNDLGAPALVLDHDGWEDCEYEECGYGYRYDRRRERGGDYDGNRAGISPGPFDRSPVDFRDNCISLDCGGRQREEEPA